MVEVGENLIFIPLAWANTRECKELNILPIQQIQFKIVRSQDKAVEYACKLYEIRFLYAEGNRKWYETYDGASKQITTVFRTRRATCIMTVLGIF